MKVSQLKMHCDVLCLFRATQKVMNTLCAQEV